MGRTGTERDWLAHFRPDPPTGGATRAELARMTRFALERFPANGGWLEADNLAWDAVKEMHLALGYVQYVMAFWDAYAQQAGFSSLFDADEEPGRQVVRPILETALREIEAGEGPVVLPTRPAPRP